MAKNSELSGGKDDSDEDDGNKELEDLIARMEVADSNLATNSVTLTSERTNLASDPDEEESTQATHGHSDPIHLARDSAPIGLLHPSSEVLGSDSDDIYVSSPPAPRSRRRAVIENNPPLAADDPDRGQRGRGHRRGRGRGRRGPG